MEKQLQKFTEELYLSFENEIKVPILLGTDEKKKLQDCLMVVKGYLSRLREKVLETGFSGTEEEAWFFKFGKPRFYQWQVYCVEKFAIRNARPAPSREGLLGYYRDQVNYYDLFFQLNRFHYEYYKLGVTELDEIYFTRTGMKLQSQSVEVPGLDLAMATPMDYLFSKFMAYEMIQSFLIAQIAELERPALSDYAVADRSQPKGMQTGLRWTGEKVNLIELAHALFVSGQIDNGKVGITEFFERMGRCFEIDLGIPKRGFDDLGSRKRLSRTHFLEILREGLDKKFDDADAYDPGKGRC